MKEVNFDKEIWEGWTVSDFIESVQFVVLQKAITNQLHTKQELKDLLKDEQPYYKKHIPDVYNHFINVLGAMNIKLS